MGLCASAADTSELEKEIELLKKNYSAIDVLAFGDKKTPKKNDLALEIVKLRKDYAELEKKLTVRDAAFKKEIQDLKNENLSLISRFESIAEKQDKVDSKSRAQQNWRNINKIAKGYADYMPNLLYVSLGKHGTNGATGMGSQIVRTTLKILKERKWRVADVEKRYYNILLADRGIINYNKVNTGPKRKIVVNFLRGTKLICNKTLLYINIKAYCKKKAIDYTSFMPETFTVKSKSEKKSTKEEKKELKVETNEKLMAFRRKDKATNSKSSTPKASKSKKSSKHAPKAVSRPSSKASTKPISKPHSSSSEKKGSSASHWDRVIKIDDERTKYLSRTQVQESEVGAWIAKSTLGCKGKDIKLSTDPKKILEFIDGLYGNWVVQKYIHDPMLWDGRKFDVRTWHLLTSLQNSSVITVYSYEHAALRVSSKQYQNSNFDDDYIHITNNAVQASHPEYGKIVKDNLLTFEHLDQMLAPLNKSVKKDIWPAINNVVLETIRSIASQILPQPCRAYQLLGYDFVITESAKVVLLEVNLTPGTSDALVDMMCEDMLDVVCEDTFKTSQPSSRSASRGRSHTPPHETKNGFFRIGTVSASS
eukprot:CAMPEP_0167746770 /NCGR_PEP_ID=MMETSP0110_2-20121227/3902_1 /TAXON_ID=629695 /ORGANISM="Gymnochlora sp., Strain CCMP2014" /LENGTH=592 /DNA_ID=CAMNT_0007631581 /DNA_START=31 /DNA_END=1809 /DNA_ORIENTATION=+